MGKRQDSPPRQAAGSHCFIARLGQARSSCEAGGLKSLLSLIAAFAATAIAAPLEDLRGGQVGRIEFTSSNPEHMWAYLRGNKGPALTVVGDLLMPKQADGKVAAVVLSHGSEGAGSLYYEVWAKALNDAGFAVFIVDSFKPRGVDGIRGTTSQLSWNTMGNVSDAVHALKLLVTHPQIDAQRIFHMGWSRGGLPVLTTAWPAFRAPVLPAGIQWAGSVAIYPGCNLRWRSDPPGALSAPLLILVGEKDDMTPARHCVDHATQLAEQGHKVSYKVYPDARHVFDRLNWPLTQAPQGTYRGCDMEITVPVSPHGWGRVEDKAAGKTFTTAQGFNEALKACQEVGIVSGESNSEMRGRAVKDVIEFLKTPR